MYRRLCHINVPGDIYNLSYIFIIILLKYVINSIMYIFKRAIRLKYVDVVQ